MEENDIWCFLFCFVACLFSLMEFTSLEHHLGYNTVLFLVVIIVHYSSGKKQMKENQLTHQGNVGAENLTCIRFFLQRTVLAIKFTVFLIYSTLFQKYISFTMAQGIQVYVIVAYFKILWGWSFFKCMLAMKTPSVIFQCLNKLSKLLSCNW